jgi:hypothetical protein
LVLKGLLIFISLELLIMHYPRVFHYENEAMKYALLAVMWALSLVAADQPLGPVYAHDRDHGGEQAGEPTARLIAMG